MILLGDKSLPILTVIETILTVIEVILTVIEVILTVIEAILTVFEAILTVFDRFTRKKLPKTVRIGKISYLFG